MTVSFEELVGQQGFASVSEFNAMVCAVDLTTEAKRDAFKTWQHEDGTKEGLAALPTE